ncbi:Zinc finger, TAZ-type [Phytophthora cinnamomi]|uniref:Zinc finger, TAZ-type n=1 Tax=Phytophthora cinnamomi TaxID=4785 RepID=UPI00355A27E1|nr:Zinc finger, TAZ-type [Phytophthora cinnamomi]
MDTLCSWCGVTRWQYKCSACDPRKEKRLCSSCSILWHARGFARSHQLTSSYGETRSYLAWWSARELDARNGSNSAGAAAKPAAEAVAANGRSTRASDKVDAKPAAPEEEKAAEGAGSVVGTEVDAGAPAEEKLDGGENENESAEGELEFETVGESVESGEDVDNASVEQGGELEEKAKAPAAEAAVAGDSAAATTDQEEPKKGESVSTNGNQEQNGDSASPDAATATPASVSAPTSDATLNSTTAAASAPAASSSAPAAPSSTQAVASREPTTQPKLVGLDKLLRWFPTTDQSINTWTQRKKLLRAETDRLNQLASESNAPIFNFPLYRWHFSDAVLIKREPASAESSEDTQAGPPTAELLADDTNNVMMIAARDKGKNAQDDNMDTQQSQDTPSEGIPGNANFNADFINQLLQAKGESGDGREVAQREFDGVIELGYAIVDASFCAPSKAQRCLLNCKSILVHLQHHLDIEVCTQPMCTAVEHHFAHLSQCKARDNSDSCEYCLRVEERRLIRSVDFMEAEQPEAEAKMQKIINDITASFTNHHPDEREQEMIQLEDELEQIEENKRDLAEKLDAARQDLRFVRKNLEHRGMPISDSRLQLHFIKVRRNEGSNSSSKKRRLLGSLD